MAAINIPFATSGPSELTSAPGTIWPRWFDVWDVGDFADREDLKAAGLREVVPVIQRLLADEAALLGGRWDRIVLAGISIGAATGVYVLFHLDIPPATGGKLTAFIGFSCRCPFVGRDLAGMRRAFGLAGAPGYDRIVANTPTLLEYCVNDPLVLVQDRRRLRETLSGFGTQVEWSEYPSGGHWFHSPEGMDDAVEFLSRYALGGGNTAEACFADRDSRRI